MTQPGVQYCPVVKFRQMDRRLSSDVLQGKLILLFSHHPSFLHLFPNTELPVVEAGCANKVL